MNKIKYSAPGKVIISGEHSVVYGKPALVSAIDLRLSFSIWKSKNKTKDKIVIFISEKVKNYLLKTKIDFKDMNFDFEIESEIPIGRGLGSSAAFSVASTAAFLEFYTEKKFPINLINQIAYEAEKIFHQNPSGVDVAISCYGGLAYYRKEFIFMRNIIPIDFNLPQIIEKNLFLIDSGKPEESTGEMVRQVKTLSIKNEQSFKKTLNSFEEITKQIVLDIKKVNIVSFQKNFLLNEKLLEKISIVSNKTKKLIKQLSKFGKGKVTGAGGKRTGSGFIIFCADNPTGLQEFCRKSKTTYFKFQKSEIGLKKEYEN